MYAYYRYLTFVKTSFSLIHRNGERWTVVDPTLNILTTTVSIAKIQNSRAYI